MAELDPTGGMAEKVVPLVRFPILMRVILPGGLATALVYPLLLDRYKSLAFSRPLEFRENWQELALIAGMVFIFGALASALNGEVYKIYEGRVLWPRRLLKLATARQEARLEKLLWKRDEAQRADRKTEYAELWYQLRLYPVDPQGKQYADRPTLLGNILSGYEDYPDKRYGMDPVFFWPRLWLEMDKKKKEEIDSGWCVADGFLSLSAVSFLGGALWVLTYLLAATGILRFDVRLPWSGTLLPGIFFILLGYAFYRLSLPFHRQNGELFKSIFDLYRDKIWCLTTMKPNETDIWNSTWGYLQYGKLSCKGTLPNGEPCDKWNISSIEKCPKCGTPVAKSTSELKNSGNFPHR
jgi:hypothetical protein